MSSIIFIGSPEKFTKNNTKNTVKKLFLVTPDKIGLRILTSFAPPLGKIYRKVYVDFLGPTLAFLFLAAIINYGYSGKTSKILLGPSEFLFLYTLFMPVVCYILTILGRSNINLFELLSLLGYALYGHVFTLLVSYMCYQESNNFFFFLCLIIFSGLSTFRLILVLLKTIPLAGPRLIICSFVAIVQVLSLVFLHFGYMHKTFVYGQNSSKQINI